MTEGPWFWSLKQHRVVAEGEEKAEDRLGPYATREEAEQALTTAQARNESWDTDPKWNDLEAEEEKVKEREEGAWGPFRV